MKNLTIYPMSSYKSKIGGLIITAAGLVLLLIVKLHGSFNFLTKPVPARQFDFFFALTVFGMYMTAFSKEKNDDERVHIIRAKALQVAFMLLAGIMATLPLISSIVNESLVADNEAICGMAAFSLGVYLVVFHVGLYFDPAWTYNDDTVIPNIRKNKRFFIIYLAVAAAIFAISFLIHKL